MVAKYIKYVGTSHNRIIYDHEWRQVGVNDQKTVVWTRANNWVVAADAISDNAMPYIVADPELVMLDGLEGVTPNQGGEDVWPEKFTGYLSAFGVPVRADDNPATEEVSVPLAPAGTGTTSTGGDAGGSGSTAGTSGSGMTGSSS